MCFTAKLSRPLDNTATVLYFLEAPVSSACVLSSSTATVALRMWGPHSSTQFSHPAPGLFILDQDLGTLLMLMVSKKNAISSCSSVSLTLVAAGHISHCCLEARRIAT